MYFLEATLYFGYTAAAFSRDSTSSRSSLMKSGVILNTISETTFQERPFSWRNTDAFLNIASTVEFPRIKQTTSSFRLVSSGKLSPVLAPQKRSHKEGSCIPTKESPLILSKSLWECWGISFKGLSLFENRCLFTKHLLLQNHAKNRPTSRNIDLRMSNSGGIYIVGGRGEDSFKGG